MTYAPTLWLNDFWLLRDKLVPLNETVSTITLHLSLYSLPPWKLMLYTQMEHSFSMQQSWGAMNDGESDEFKRVLTEGNPYFLGLTMLVSLMHSVFDALAFKNDIGFWKGKKDVAGLSVRTIGFNAGCQAVIFLYLLDNDTSFVVLASTGVGLLIELWKLTQAMDVTLAVVNGRPSLRLKDKASYTASRTDEHDAVAMKWLSLCLIPCVGGYALYSLAYDTHRSWYSWILSSLVGAVYMFGFVLMCPQVGGWGGGGCGMGGGWASSARRKPQSMHSPPSLASTALPQLQAEIGRPPPVAPDDVQVPQHDHRRPLCVCHQNAHPAPPVRVPGRHRVCGLPVPAVGVPGRPVARQRVWVFGRGGRRGGGGGRARAGRRRARGRAAGGGRAGGRRAPAPGRGGAGSRGGPRLCLCRRQKGRVRTLCVVSRVSSGTRDAMRTACV